MEVYVKDMDMDKITVVDYNGQHQTFSVNDVVYVDETTYQKEFLEQPRKYSFWSSVLQQAKRVQAEQNDMLKQAHDRLYNEAYNALTEQKIKPTKDLIEAQIGQSDEYFKAKQRANEADYSANRVNSLVKALEQRASMLQSFGAEQRKEQHYGN